MSEQSHNRNSNNDQKTFFSYISTEGFSNENTFIQFQSAGQSILTSEAKGT